MHRHHPQLIQPPTILKTTHPHPQNTPTNTGRPEDSGISLAVIAELGPDFPVFGVCMGHQCIGQSFGGRVIRAPCGVMHGKTSDVFHTNTGLLEVCGWCGCVSEWVGGVKVWMWGVHSGRHVHLAQKHHLHLPRHLYTHIHTHTCTPTPTYTYIHTPCHTQGLDNPFKAARYHSLVIEKDTCPEELEVTAWTEDGTIMAVRHKKYPHVQVVCRDGGWW